MSPHIESSKGERPLKRARSFDGCDFESLRPIKRNKQLPPTTPPPSLPLDKDPRPRHPSAVAPLTPPGSSQASRKRKFEGGNSASSSLNKRRVEDWLQIKRTRRNSYPPRLELNDSDSDTATATGQRPRARRDSCPPQLESCDQELRDQDAGKGQRPLLEVLQEMSQSQRQSFGPGSATSGRNPRSVTTHPDYRSILRNNNIYMDRTGVKIPQELREFLDSSILKQQSSPLTPEEIAEAVNTATDIADSPESNIYDLIGTAMLPIKRSDVGRGGNTPWYTDQLPKSDEYDISLAQPKPDIHCGYLVGQRSTWAIKENAVIDHPHAKKITQPAKGNSFPFFVFELKSEAMGGTLWQAENQAAGSGACCVMIKRWLYREAHGTDDQPVVDSIAFSACVTHREVVFHVHHYSTADKRLYMSRFGAFQTVDEVEGCNNIVSNIFKHGLGARQDQTLEQVKLLYPFPPHWKRSRSASVMESQNPPAEEDLSNKSQRTDDGA
ncbi:MAG: hypothetical protein MMC23_010115 [Stictis urceolatum]|nr:hypothetical protein [Stictis urceolata]